MNRKVIVAGVGMLPFSKPGQSDTYDVMGANAIREALADAGISYDLVEQAYASYVYGDSTSGQKAIYAVGMTGIPVVNVNNNCSSGSTALYLARQAVEGGIVECALAVGFEQMQRGALVESWTDRPSPIGAAMKSVELGIGKQPEGTPMTAYQFGAGALEHMKLFGTKAETFAKIRVKASQHAARNPKAVFRNEVSLEEVMESPMIFAPLTRLQCCPPTCGGAAAIVCSEAFASKHGINTGVQIVAQAMTTDGEGTFDGSDMRNTIGFDMSRRAAQQVYEASGVGPEDISVCELHDCFTANELLTYEALGFAEEGQAEKFINDGENTYGGKVVTNPSGGLLSKGHPLGATGLAQCYELTMQLRGNADQRQVDGLTHALQHNIGLGGAAVVTLYARN
ncbi:MAG: acetyl-CoA acetyltransferase [Gammaproteobacteria bacterium]|jgi:acetyl-CoA acetyltransferase